MSILCMSTVYTITIQKINIVVENSVQIGCTSAIASGSIYYSKYRWFPTSNGIISEYIMTTNCDILHIIYWYQEQCYVYAISYYYIGTIL